MLDIQCETRKYKLIDPRWRVIWEIRPGQANHRECHLYHEGVELDPLDSNDLSKIHKIIPSLMDKLQLAISSWNRYDLLSPDNIPFLLQYAIQHRIKDNET